MCKSCRNQFFKVIKVFCVRMEPAFVAGTVDFDLQKGFETAIEKMIHHQTDLNQMVLDLAFEPCGSCFRHQAIQDTL